MQKLHAAVPNRAEGRGSNDDTDWKFPLAMAIAAAQAPLRAHFQAASKEAAVVRKAGYKQWIQKALANGMGGAARYAKLEQPADLSIVQIRIGQGPPKPGDAATRPAAKHICWATDLDKAAAGALQEWGENLGLPRRRAHRRPRPGSG